MGDEHREKSIHPLTEFCVFLSLIFAAVTGEKIVSTRLCWMLKGGGLYMGSRNVTIEGTVCQQWSQDSPRKVAETITDTMFPDGSKEAARNYCRNPDIKNKEGIWCYTTLGEKEWDFCDPCPDKYEGYNACVLEQKGAGYHGKLTHTKSFQDCQPWKEHPEKQFLFPDGSADLAKNYCRNPDSKNRDGPWCFVNAGPAKWDYCDVCAPFQGKVTVAPGTNILAKYAHEGASRLACLHWCITMAYCVGIAVQDTDKKCWYMTKFGGNEEKNQTDLQIYTVSRTCSPEAKGKKAYFVIFTGVKLRASYILSKDSTTEKCDEACISEPKCQYYEWLEDKARCLSQYEYSFSSTYEDPVEGGVITRVPVHCDPSLQPSADVKAALEEQNAGVSRIQLKSEGDMKILIIISGIVAGAILLLVCVGCVCYKCRKKKNGKGKGKDKGKGSKGKKKKTKSKKKK